MGSFLKVMVVRKAWIQSLKCLYEAIFALSHGRLAGESRTSGLIHYGNENLEAFKYYPEISPEERQCVMKQKTMLRQLETILGVYRLSRLGQCLDALSEVAKLPFLHLDPMAPDFSSDVFKNLSPNVQACVPDLLRVALQCLDNVTDTDGSLRALSKEIADFLGNNLNRNWPRDLYEKVAQNL